MDYVTPFIEWLLQSDYIKNNKLFLNAVEAQDNNVQIVTQQIAENQIKRYVDGSKSYPITFYVNNYKSVSYNPLVKTMLEGSENLAVLFDVSKIIEFVKDMEEQGNYPAFADNITVEKVYCKYNTPPTPAIDNGFFPALTKFTIPIVCEVFEDVE